jgi:hypothetical protein
MPPTDSFQVAPSFGDSAIVDVTADYRRFCRHPDSAWGWVIWIDDAPPTGAYRVIFSTEYTSMGGTRRPRLEIYYTPKRAAFVLDDTSSAEAIGVDSLLYLAMTDDLDYEVDYMTDEDVASYTSNHFDTTYDVVIWAGEEVSGPSPSSRADTIAASSVGWLSLYRWNYDENHLGIGQDLFQDNLVVAVNRVHWITRVLQDTLFMFSDGSAVTGNYAFAPESSHAVVPLIVDESFAEDTSYVAMCAADSGMIVYNGHRTKGRRAFLGLYHEGGIVRDSCQFFTVFNRAVAWCAGDTLNHYVNHDFCFSGWMEIEDAWGENGSGDDSLRSYGGSTDLKTGFGFNEKVAFMKIGNDAMWRKLPYDSVDVDEFMLRMTVQTVNNGPEDSLWQQTNGLRLIKLLWKCGRESGSATSDFVSWTYRHRTDVDSFPWTVGGAHGINSDVVDTVLDSISQSRLNTDTDSVLIWTIPPTFARRMIEDTIDNHGWVWHNLWNNQEDQINDAEIIYYSSDHGDPRDRPLIIVRLLDYSIRESSVTRRRLPIIGGGLLEN